MSADDSSDFLKLAQVFPMPGPPPAESLPSDSRDLYSPRLLYHRAMKEYERLMYQVSRGLAQQQNKAGGRIAELEMSLTAAQHDLQQAISEKAELEEQLKREQLNPNGRSGLQRVLIAAIAGGYGIGPEHKLEEKRESVARLVTEDALEKLGMKLDRKTVRKYVEAGWEAYARWPADDAK